MFGNFSMMKFLISYSQITASIGQTIVQSLVVSMTVNCQQYFHYFWYKSFGTNLLKLMQHSKTVIKLFPISYMSDSIIGTAMAGGKLRNLSFTRYPTCLSGSFKILLSCSCFSLEHFWHLSNSMAFICLIQSRSLNNCEKLINTSWNDCQYL